MKSRNTAMLAVLAAILILPVVASGQYLGNVRFSEPSGSHLPLDHWVEVTIDYKVTAPGGARIWVGPMSGGSGTPGAGVSGSVVVPPGSGTVVRGFDVSQPGAVDHVRVYMYDATTVTLVQEIFLPLYLYYDDHGVFHIEMSASSPSWLRHGSNIDIGFDYESSHAGNLRITARPYTDGSLTPGYGASGSVSLPPSGSYSQWFNFTEDRDVDAIRFQITTDDWSTVIHEFLVPVDLHWRSHGIINPSLNPPRPRSMLYGEMLMCRFEYDTPTNYNITVGPAFDGGFCHPFDGPHDVDEVRIMMREEDGPDLFTGHLGCCYRYDFHAIRDIEFVPGPAAVLGLNENVEINFSYAADYPGGVLIFARPLNDGHLCTNYAAHSSPVYPAGTGVGTAWFTMTAPDEVDQVRFTMKDPSTQEIVFQWFEDARFFFGASGTVTDVPGDAPPRLLVLEQNYPNPFNPLTVIPFTLAEEGLVRLRIHDMMGRLVAVPLEGRREAGRHEVRFGAEALNSGAYFYSLEFGGETQTRKMMILK